MNGERLGYTLLKNTCEYFVGYQVTTAVAFSKPGFVCMREPMLYASQESVVEYYCRRFEQARVGVSSLCNMYKRLGNRLRGSHTRCMFSV